MARGFDNNVIVVYFDVFAHQMTKDFVYHSLIGCSDVFKAKWHDPVKVINVVCDESGFVHVGCGHGNLIVTAVCVKKAEDLITSHVVNKSVNIG